MLLYNDILRKIYDNEIVTYFYIRNFDGNILPI